jgi:subfamily B ATP-binding cassette protein HlyB/CyaB
LSEPILTELSDGRFVVVLYAANDTVSIQGLHKFGAITMALAKFEGMWTGTVARCVSLGPEPVREIGVRTLLQYVMRFKSAFFSLAIAAIFVDAVELSIPLTFMVIIDSVIVNRAAATLDVVIIIFVVMVTFGGLLSQLSDRVRASVGKHLGFELSSRFMRHVLSLPTDLLKGIRGTEILSRISDLAPVHRLVADLVAIVWVDALFVLVCLGIGFYLSKLLGLVMLMRLPFYMLGAYVALSKLRKVLQQNLRSRRESSQLIVDTMDGIETIKSRHAEDYIGRRIETKLSEAAEQSEDGTDFRNMVDRYSSVVDRFAVGAFLWIGTYQVINGDLTAGQIMAVYLINRLMMRPMNRLARMLYDFQRVAVGIEEVNRFLSKEPEVNSRHLIKLNRIDGRIRFDDVRFRYPNNESDVLRGISFEVQPGEVVGIVGRSGSGKSTILKLVQRLYLPNSGRVEIDDTGIEILHPHWLRERLGCVPQECWLFGQSIGENIRLGSPAISRSDVIEAARLACAHEFIIKMIRGYDTVIQGGALSGGERQRIAIARAIVHRPKVLLFDESTSALDHETEAAVLKNMETVFKDRTVIIVAHRVSALRHAHRVIVLGDGEISQIGTPKELMASGGYFARMVGDQFDMLESLVRGGGRADPRCALRASGPETIAPLVSHHSGA